MSSINICKCITKTIICFELKQLFIFEVGIYIPITYKRKLAFLL